MSAPVIDWDCGDTSECDPAVKFDKAIPIPPKQCGRKRIWGFSKADALTMKPGDSFFQPCPPEKLHSARNALNATGYNARIKFTTRAVEGGVRIWRLPDE